MRYALTALVMGAVLGAASGVTAGQQPPDHQHPPGGPAGEAMGAPGMMHGGDCLGMSGGRLDAVKHDLGITAAQEPRWEAFAEAVRTNAQSMGPMGHMGHMGAGPAAPEHGMTLPQRLDMHERMMAQHLEALRRVKAPLLALYSSLTPAQKAKADAMCGQHGDTPPAH